MSESIGLEERKAQVLIGLRGYDLEKKVKYKNESGFFVKMHGEKKAIIYCIPTQGTIGVQYINQLKKIMMQAEVQTGIIVTSGRYTQAAKANAKKKGIELIPRVFPSFNIFDHVHVPKHEILSTEEREKILAQYRINAYQLPRILASDSAVKAIGGKPGDIVKIIRKSSTAGEYLAYRYVVEG